MKTTQFAFRALWTEYHRTGEKDEPTGRAMCGKLWSFWDRESDPINGVDSPSLVAMARQHMSKVLATLGDTGSDIEIICESRPVNRSGDEVLPIGSWEPLATVMPAGDGSTSVVFPPTEAGSHNAGHVREAAAKLARFPS